MEKTEAKNDLYEKEKEEENAIAEDEKTQASEQRYY